MAPGSALVVTQVVDDGDSERHAATRAGAHIYHQTTAPFVSRTREAIAQWFSGFRPVPPGLVDADAWRLTGNGKRTAPIVAGVGILQDADEQRRTRSGTVGPARPGDGERRNS